MFQWYPTSSNRVPLNRQGHVARMFLVCQIAVFEPFCTWTVHCTLEFRRRMVQPSAQRCDRHQNRSGYFPPLPLPMKPVGPELQLVGGRPSRVIVLEQRWMLIYFIYYESWENPVGLDSWCYEEAGATTQPSILSAGWSHAISVPCSNNRLRLRCITCADAHVRLPLLPGCCDHGITRWIVGSKNSWRMLEVTAAKLLQLKSIEVQYRCWDTIIFYSQMKCFFVFFLTFRCIPGLIVYIFGASSCNSPGVWKVQPVRFWCTTHGMPDRRPRGPASGAAIEQPISCTKSMDMLWHFMVQVANPVSMAIPILTNTQHDDSRKSGNQQGCHSICWSSSCSRVNLACGRRYWPTMMLSL